MWLKIFIFDIFRLFTSLLQFFILNFFMYHNQYFNYYLLLCSLKRVGWVIYMFKDFIDERADWFFFAASDKQNFVFKTWIRTCKNTDVAMVTESSIRVSVFSDDAALFISSSSPTREDTELQPWTTSSAPTGNLTGCSMSSRQSTRD